MDFESKRERERVDEGAGSGLQAEAHGCGHDSCPYPPLKVHPWDLEKCVWSRSQRCTLKSPSYTHTPISTDAMHMHEAFDANKNAHAGLVAIGAMHMDRVGDIHMD